MCVCVGGGGGDIGARLDDLPGCPPRSDEFHLLFVR